MMLHMKKAGCLKIAIRSIGLVLIFAIACLQGVPSETARQESDRNTGQTVYVDGSSGLDTNVGTSSRPLQSLPAATRIASQNYIHGVSTSVMIQPGVYREAVSMNASTASPSASVSFVAVKPGTVVVSGADVWNGWIANPSNPGEYTHPWIFQWGPCNIPKDWPAIPSVVDRREIIFVNDVLLKQVMSPGDLSEGMFYVDEASRQIRIHPPAGTNMATATVEVGVRPHLFNVHGISNFTLSGLTFTKAATCLPGGSVELFDSSNDRIENSVFDWNNWQGLVLHNVSNLQISGVRASHNGGSGLSGYQIKNMNLKDTETSFNNWRGAWGNFYYFSQAGTKVLRVHDSAFRNFRAFGNQTSGLWFDSDDANILIENSYLSSNQFNGLLLEANQGPITINSTRICQNKAEGVRVLDSDGVVIQGSLLYANKGSQILADGRQKSRSDHDWETKSTYTAKLKSLTLIGNTVVGIGPDQMLFKTFHVDADSATTMFSTLVSNSNNWYNSATSRVFQYDPELSGGRKVHNLDLTGWQSFTAQDKNSKFSPPQQDPAEACANP
jgi:hypothetical protein